MTRQQKKLALVAFGAGIGAFAASFITIKLNPRIRQLAEEAVNDVLKTSHDLRDHARELVDHGKQVVREAIGAGRQAYHESMARSAPGPHDGHVREPRPMTGT